MLNIVTREVTGLLQAREGAPKMDLTAVRGIALHHTGFTGDVPNAVADPASYMQVLQAFYLDMRGYSDVAYNFVINASGQVLEGRGLRYRCAANGTNESNLAYPAVLFPGDFRAGGNQLTAAQIGAFRQLRAFLLGLQSKATDVKPHGFFKATECPGASITSMIPELARSAPAGGVPGAAPVLRKGSQGNAVKCLQMSINNWGGATLKTDGDFGAATEIAVKRFQTAHKLVVDGWVGKQTWRALENYGGCATV